jgi:hypothetical protein
MEEEGYLKTDTWFQLIRVAGAGHTFRPRAAQETLRKLLRNEVELSLKGRPA